MGCAARTCAERTCAGAWARLGCALPVPAPPRGPQLRHTAGMGRMRRGCLGDGRKTPRTTLVSPSPRHADDDGTPTTPELGRQLAA